MSKVKIQGNASGTGIFTVAAPATNTDRTITLPDVDATVLTTAGGTIDGALSVDDKIVIQQDSGSNNRLTLRGKPSSSYRWNIDNYGDANALRIFRENDSDGSAGVIFAQIDANGRVTTPYQPAFKAYPPSSFSQSSGVQNITFNTTTYNIGSYYNTSTGIFTAPISGRYFFEAAVYQGSAGDGYYGIRFLVNGANKQDGYVRGGFGDITPAFCFSYQLAANDTVRIATYNASTTTVYAGETACHFAGLLLG